MSCATDGLCICFTYLFIWFLLSWLWTVQASDILIRVTEDMLSCSKIVEAVSKLVWKQSKIIRSDAAHSVSSAGSNGKERKLLFGNWMSLNYCILCNNILLHQLSLYFWKCHCALTTVNRTGRKVIPLHSGADVFQFVLLDSHRKSDKCQSSQEKWGIKIQFTRSFFLWL